MVTLAIQAGGESRRMGADKALLPFVGRPLIMRPLERLIPLADELLVTSNQPEDYKFLGLTPITDRMPGTGALGGLYTALSAARHPYVAVAACDMPFASLGIFSLELALIQELGCDAVIPRTEAGTEPFHAIYRRDACLPYIQAALQQGERRVDAWFSQVRIHYLQRAELMPYDPDELAFMNINTPEDMRQAERIARRETGLDNLE